MPTPSITILVADDQASIRREVRSHLESALQVNVVEAEDGHQAIHEIHEKEPNLIICDIEMPGLNGFEVLRFVRAKHLAIDLPVLMLTSRTSAKDKVRALDAGANDYVIKPVELGELLARVRTHLRLHSLHRELLLAKIEEIGAAHDGLVEREKLVALSRLAATVTNEIAEPLNVFRGAAGKLREVTKEKTTSTLRTITTDCENAVERMVSLVEGLEQLSPPSPIADGEEIELTALLDEVMGEAQTLHSADGRLIDWLPPDPVHVRSSVTHLKRGLRLVLSFLCGRKTGADDPPIAVRLSSNTDCATVEVIDLGYVLTPEEQRALFESRVTGENRGVGVNLDLSLAFVSLSRAGVQVRAAADKVARCTHYRFSIPTKAPQTV